MPPARTKPGTRKLSDVARHVVVPSGIVSTGYPAVRDKCRDLGITHEDWQQGLGRLILGKRKTGKYAATVGGVVLSIPRQVGKTFTVGSIIFALCLLFPGLTVIWTAHRARMSNETFRAMQGMARRAKVKPHVLSVRQANGEQEITFRNGSRILFGAREQGFGRGFAEVDVIVFDEAQILTERALDDMIATTNQSRHPAGALLFYMGTPPKPTDSGEAFTNKRAKALSGKSSDMVYVELSGDQGADPDDRKQWSIANPSYPKWTPAESMLRLRENVGSDESFLREGLGIWDPDAKSTDLALDYAAWIRLSDPHAGAPVIRTFGLDGTLDGTWASIGAAGDGRSDGRILVEHVTRAKGRTWIVPRCKELDAEHGPAVFVVDGRGPLAPLIPDLSKVVQVIVMDTDDVIAAASGLVDAINDATIIHGPQDLLDAAVKDAKKRPIGERGYAFGRKDVDVDALNSASFAHWGATKARDKSPANNVW